MDNEVTLKGVVTEVIDNGNMGEINCGKNNIFTFSSDQLSTGYSPVLKDIVEFTLIEDKPYNIKLYHRQQNVSADPTSVDLKVKCSHCGERIIPKAKVVNGKVSATFCPKCSQELEKFSTRPKPNFLNWILAIIIGILITACIYFFAITP